MRDAKRIGREVLQAMRRTAVTAGRGMLFALAAVLLTAQVQMPNPKEISGQPLPSNDLPAGTISVRVIRGSFANNLPNQKVDVAVDGKVRTLTTDAEGRVQVSGLAPGTRVKA